MLEKHSEDNPYGLKFNSDRTRHYRAKGYWGDATLLDCWNASVLRYPDKTAVMDSHGEALTFCQADAMAARIAGFLAAGGIGPGDRVSFQLPGWAEFLPICIACLKVGAVLNPIPTNLRFEETRYMLSACESKALFVPHHYKNFYYQEMVDRLRPLLPNLGTVISVDKFQEGAHLPELRHILSRCPPPGAGGHPRARADELATIMFTSGSEGRPKGVMLSHNNIIASETVFAAHFGISQYDVMLMPAPVTHATGYLHGVMMPFVMSATSILQDEFNPEMTLRLIEGHRCTATMASEPFLHDMVSVLRHSPHDLRSLRFFICGGSAVTRTLIEEAQSFGIIACNVYGSSESIGHVGALPAMSPDKRLATAGTPFPGVEVRVVDKNKQPVPPGVEGEEASRGPQVFLGYLNNPELTEQALDDDGWYYSGDLCVMDDDGCVRITGRIKDIIVRGGENISSLEVETILLRHPAIRDIAVVAMPDPRLREKACAYVVLEHSANSLRLADLAVFMQGQDVAKHKIPERLEVVRELPRTASGKVKKEELRKDAAEKVALAACRKSIDRAL